MKKKVVVVFPYFSYFSVSSRTKERFPFLCYSFAFYFLFTAVPISSSDITTLDFLVGSIGDVCKQNSSLVFTVIKSKILFSCSGLYRDRGARGERARRTCPSPIFLKL